MRTLRFHGASDDLLLAEEGPHLRLEASSFRTSPAIAVHSPSHGTLLVVGTYLSGPYAPACWAVGVAPLDEGAPIPAWPVALESGEHARYAMQPYASAVLRIEVPDDAVLIDATRSDWREQLDPAA